MVRIAAIRYQDRLGWLSNKWLFGALIGSILLQLLIIYTPLNALFHIVPLGWLEWLVIAAGAIVGYVLTIAITRLVLRFVEEG